ncbi:phosphoribosyl 1,2-cyclic phosphate phosphodiesterase [Wenyingzhuangia heitensis]|uniref:Phosphoribosyl 1,2-cyclic phosphate phosphodiesterase n=1 Tax=Wenyingzhuangia heitensis TaxID=1487859 RepID=A0ABX0UF18_9FLAO|nr:MBL fold metallo-hydrolase [Wenyingzhuangia heitensis]NIJ46131.1 phosphoribosyl 1,2-cyclic phosphate phosphodiesterase [Wenyingzhuangia heitensis]
MKVTFLGTGTSQGVPMLLSDEPVNFSTDFKDKRMRSSVLIEWEGFSCLVDCGADFRMQMLNNKVTTIDAILFTHEHSDHIAGLDDIRPYCYKKGPMPVFAMQRVMESLYKRYEYIFTTENRYPGAAAVIPTVIDESIFVLGNKDIIPIKVNHGNLPILGYRVENFAYLTDVKTLDASEVLKLKNLEVLVINALRIEEHPTHLNLDEALALVNVLRPKKVYFTHISHRLGFHKEVSEQLPENVFLAYDGLEIKL